MPVSKIISNADFVEVDVGGRSLRVNSAALSGNTDKKAAAMTELLQAFLDTRQLLSSLPDDDPDKTIDPGRGHLFHQRIAGKDYLVGRGAIVNVTWDGSRFDCSARRASSS